MTALVKKRSAFMLVESFLALTLFCGILLIEMQTVQKYLKQERQLRQERVEVHREKVRLLKTLEQQAKSKGQK